MLVLVCLRKTLVRVMYKYYQYQIGPDVYTHRSTEAGADILTCRFHGNQMGGFCPKVLRIQVCRVC